MRFVFSELMYLRKASEENRDFELRDCRGWCRLLDILKEWRRALQRWMLVCTQFLSTHQKSIPHANFSRKTLIAQTLDSDRPIVLQSLICVNFTQSLFHNLPAVSTNLSKDVSSSPNRLFIRIEYSKNDMPKKAAERRIL